MEMKINRYYENRKSRYWEIRFFKNEYSEIQKYKRKEKKATGEIVWYYSAFQRLTNARQRFLERHFINYFKRK